MTKIAHVYERNDGWYFQSSSKATTGLWFATPPLIALSRHDQRQRKGEAALEVIHASKEGLALPEDTRSVIVPLLAKAGVKSWPEFMKKAKCIGLELENNRLTLIPHRQIPRSKGSLEGIEGQDIVLSAEAAPDEIGAALEEAISRCQ